MNTHFTFEKVEPACMDTLRKMQLTQMKGPVQEYNEEGIITYKADFVRIVKRGETAGYACIGSYQDFKDTVLEYYLLEEFRSDAGEVVILLAKRYGCKAWIVNTQDFFALPVMLDLGLPYHIDAYLFAVDPSADVDVEWGQSIMLTITNREELKEVFPFINQDGFYSGGGMESVEARLAEQELYSLRLDGRLIGVGFVSRLQRTPAFADIAMIINPDERHRGWGKLIVKALIHQCRLRKMIPTAVCSVMNKNSRKTLEKAGFHLAGCVLCAKFEN